MGTNESVVGNLGGYQVMTTAASEAGGPEMWIQGLQKRAVERAVEKWGGPAAAVLLLAGVGVGVGAGSQWLRNRRAHKPADLVEDRVAIANLGSNLSALARSEDELDCLEVFAQIVETEATLPTLLCVIVAADGARVLTIGNPNPGLTLQVDDDLDFDIKRLWFGDH